MQNSFPCFSPADAVQVLPADRSSHLPTPTSVSSCSSHVDFSTVPSSISPTTHQCEARTGRADLGAPCISMFFLVTSRNCQHWVTSGSLLTAITTLNLDLGTFTYPVVENWTDATRRGCGPNTDVTHRGRPPSWAVCWCAAGNDH